MASSSRCWRSALLRHPFVTLAGAAVVLQSSPAAARLAVEAVEGCRVDGQPLLARHADAWRLDPDLLLGVVSGRYGEMPPTGELAWFRSGGAEVVRRVALAWLAEHRRVSSGDVAVLTGAAQPQVSVRLSALAEAGEGLRRGEGRGRSAHFVAYDA